MEGELLNEFLSGFEGSLRKLCFVLGLGGLFWSAPAFTQATILPAELNSIPLDLSVEDANTLAALRTLHLVSYYAGNPQRESIDGRALIAWQRCWDAFNEAPLEVFTSGAFRPGVEDFTYASGAIEGFRVWYFMPRNTFALQSPYANSNDTYAVTDIVPTHDVQAYCFAADDRRAVYFLTEADATENFWRRDETARWTYIVEETQDAGDADE